MRRILRNITCILFAIITISCDIRGSNLTDGASNLHAPEAKTKYLRVTKVVDGDTFWVDNGSKKGLKVRLIGIDAPESRKSFNKEVQYFGKESAAYLTGLIAGKKVKLVSDITPLDRFGRTLSYVYLEDGTFVNAELIKKGYAVVMTLAPNVEYAEYFVGLQKEARKKKRGLWQL